MPSLATAFEKRSKDACFISISYYIDGEREELYFRKVYDKWISPIRKCRNGEFELKVLERVRTRIHLKKIRMSNKQALPYIEKEMCFLSNIMSIKNNIEWCQDKYVNDEDGRYWLNIYHGCGDYVLIIKDRLIYGSIYIDSLPSLYKWFSFEAQIKTWESYISLLFGEKPFQIIKVSGSCTLFLLNNYEDAKWIDTYETNWHKVVLGKEINGLEKDTFSQND